MQMGFMMMLKKAPGQVMVAKDGDEIVGVMRMAEWPDCQKSTPHGIALLPLFLILRGAAYRLWKFRKIWGIHDPKKPHWHIDPLGVLPDRQGQGIGSQLLNYFCEHVDGLNMPAYHETDQEQNVRLYERFGYKVIETEEVFSVTNWFLWRDPQ